ncbi:MAG: thiolase family protein [Desulfotomaculales bacterium]
MRKVGIIGVATTPFKSRWVDKTLYELAYDVTKAVLSDAGITKDKVDSCVYGIYNDFFARQYQPDCIVHDYIGMAPRPAMRVNTGGATGGSAIRAGIAEVASGMSDVCLVLGVEKCNDCFNYEAGATTPEVLKAINYTADLTYEFPTGRTAASVFALAIIAHQNKYNGLPTKEQMAKVSVKNHRNAMKNPVAQSPKLLTVEEVVNARMISYPFGFYDNCLYTEGAAAVILASEDVARKLCPKPVWVTGVGAALDWAFLGNRTNLYEFQSSREAAVKAYKMAGIANPRQEIDLAELHDAFTGTEIMAYEDCFFCEPGEGGKLIDEEVVEPWGELPVNLSGGLIGCGHAVGATGIMQTVEIVLHLRGEAGERQVKEARRGLVQSIGGIANAWTVVLILEREGK